MVLQGGPARAPLPLLLLALAGSAADATPSAAPFGVSAQAFADAFNDILVPRSGARVEATDERAREHAWRMIRRTGALPDNATAAALCSQIDPEALLRLALLAAVGSCYSGDAPDGGPRVYYDSADGRLKTDQAAAENKAALMQILVVFILVGSARMWYSVYASPDAQGKAG